MRMCMRTPAAMPQASRRAPCGALANAQIDLDVGFTTVLDMDLRGLLLHGRPARRDQQRQRARPAHAGGRPVAQSARHQLLSRQSVGAHLRQAITENKNVNGPWLARSAVREAKLHGVDYIKIYTTQDFAGTEHMWKPDATLVNSPSLTPEEVEAIVDEAHRLGLKVACHTYGGEGMTQLHRMPASTRPTICSELDDADVKVMLEKKLPFVPTVDDLVALEQADLQGNRRQELAPEAPGAGGAAGGCGRRSDRVRQRRDLGRRSRTASRPASSTTTRNGA